MKHCRTRGLILCVSDHSESDKIVTLFSPDLGKVSGIAKGAKRSKKRFVNKLEEFTLLQVLYTPPKRDGLLFLHDADLENAFLSLRTMYSRYVAAAFIDELTLRFTREHDPDPLIFALLLWAMEGLENGRDPREVCALFLLRILGATGYQPILDCCGTCGVMVQSGHNFFLNNGGGSLVCNSCSEGMKGASAPITVQTLKFLHHAQCAELANLERLRLSEQNINEALNILHRYTLHLLQHEIHSWQQIKYLGSASK